MHKQKLKKNIFFVTLVLLLIAHGAYYTLVPYYLINIFTLFIIVILIYLNYTGKNKIFETLIIIYIGGHFSILDNWGGFFVLSSFLLFFLTILKGKSKFYKDTPINFLIIVFVISNILGWVFKNKIQIPFLLLGIISLAAYLMLFFASKRLLMEKWHISLLIKTIVIMLIYQALVSLNTYYSLIDTDLTHLLPTSENRFGLKYMTGTFGHSELYGEFALIMFLFLLPFSFSNKTETIFGIKRTTLIIGLITAFINILLSASRSAFGLSFIGIFIFFYLTRYSLKFKVSNFIIYGAIVFFGLALLWKPMKLNFIAERFIDPKQGAPIISNSDFDLITGEGTARELAFSYFWKRFPEEKWWIGYGWGLPESNRIAWFKDPETPRADYHSLYLSLIMIYGYIGSICYLLLFFITISRLFKVLKDKKFELYLRLTAVAFFLLMIFMLLNEYKISLLRMPHYHLLTWLWLGFSNSLYYSSKMKLYENTLAGTIPIK